MLLKYLKLQRYRNFAKLDWKPGERFNVLVGDNGHGKTNVLEAIAYLSSLRSFRKATSEDLIQDSESQAELRADLFEAGVTSERYISVVRHGDGRRKVEINGKRPSSFRHFQNTLPVVVFHPDTLAIMHSPELRRAWLDDMIGKIDVVHSVNIHDYERAIRSRNRLLKQQAPKSAIQSFDPILANLSVAIRKARSKIVEDIVSSAQASLDYILNKSVKLSLEYRYKEGVSVENILAALDNSYAHDQVRGHTTVGCHTDDLHIIFTQRRARHYTSQGQTRALVLALKLAEQDQVEASTGCAPLFLLDDVSSELDAYRSEKFFELLSKKSSQVFLTTTRASWISLSEERSDWRVEHGQLSALG